MAIVSGRSRTDGLSAATVAVAHRAEFAVKCSRAEEAAWRLRRRRQCRCRPRVVFSIVTVVIASRSRSDARVLIEPVFGRCVSTSLRRSGSTAVVAFKRLRKSSNRIIFVSPGSRNVVEKKTREREREIILGVITGTQLSFLTFGTADESKLFVHEEFQTGSLRIFAKFFIPTEIGIHNIVSTPRKKVSFCILEISVKTFCSGVEREREKE